MPPIVDLLLDLLELTVDAVPAKDPVAQADHTQDGHREGQPQGYTSCHPFPREDDHPSIIARPAPAAWLAPRWRRSGTFGTINLIDLVVSIAVLIGLANGYRRGFWLSVAQYLGLVGGVVAGAALAPRVLDALGIQGATIRPWAAVLVLGAGGSVGSTLGYWLGENLHRRVLRRAPSHPPELVGGALFSAAAVLLTSWFLGLTFDRGPSPEVARLVQHSQVLRALDALLPRPPGFLAGVEAVLANVPFAQTFAGLEPSVAPLQLPASVDTPGIQEAAASVYRVEGRGCGGLVTGSAYPVAPGYLITNAHVVAGTSGTTLSRGPLRRGGIPATVVLFDPLRDVAVLYAPSVSAPPLSPAPAGRGTQGAVIGYPGGGNEDIEPAVVDAATVALGRDIYNDQLVRRSIWIVTAVVRPGNSGGPLVDLQGHVIGLVFAASASNPDQAYALTDDEVAPDVQQAMASHRPIDTSAFACAV